MSNEPERPPWPYYVCGYDPGTMVTTSITIKPAKTPTGCMYERQKAMKAEIERQSENKCSVSFETPCERCFSLNYEGEPYGECLMASWSKDNEQ